MEPGQFAGGAVAIATLLLALLVGLVGRRVNGRFRFEPSVATNGGTEMADNSAGSALTPDDLGNAGFGERATLVQFSSAFCQPCWATRRILADVGEMVEGVAHVEIDAESHLDLVRRLNILRTPTVLVLDAQGRIVRRASGQPRKAT